MIFGLTGGIAVGKSTVSSLFKDLGAEIVDADALARDVLDPGTKSYRKIVKRFGESVLNEDGTVNRDALGSIVFSDHSARRFLNKATQLSIFIKILKRLFWRSIPFTSAWSEVTLLDAPLLFETKILVWFVKQTIVVFVDEATQLERLMARNGYDETEARNRMNSQMPLSEKLKRADHVIDNSGTVEETRERVEALYGRLSRQRGGLSALFMPLFIGASLGAASVVNFFS